MANKSADKIFQMKILLLMYFRPKFIHTNTHCATRLRVKEINKYKMELLAHAHTCKSSHQTKMNETIKPKDENKTTK